MSGDVVICVVCGPGALGGVRGTGLLRKAFDVGAGEAGVGNFLHLYIFGILTHAGVIFVKIEFNFTLCGDGKRDRWGLINELQL